MHPDYTTTMLQHGLRLPSKVVGWLRRYLPAEVTGTVAALLVITLARHWDLNAVAIALIGVWGEVAGFYGAIIVQDWLADRRQQRQFLWPNQQIRKVRSDWLTLCGNWLTSVRQTIRFLGQLLRNLLLEFGPAELLDSFILRPALLTLAMQLIADLPLALVTGKVAADLLFYTVTIGSVELRRKLLAV